MKPWASATRLRIKRLKFVFCFISDLGLNTSLFLSFLIYKVGKIVTGMLPSMQPPIKGYDLSKPWLLSNLKTPLSRSLLMVHSTAWNQTTGACHSLLILFSSISFFLRLKKEKSKTFSSQHFIQVTKGLPCSFRQSESMRKGQTAIGSKLFLSNAGGGPDHPHFGPEKAAFRVEKWSWFSAGQVNFRPISAFQINTQDRLRLTSWTVLPSVSSERTVPSTLAGQPYTGQMASLLCSESFPPEGLKAKLPGFLCY